MWHVALIIIIKAFLHQVRLHQDHSVLTLQLMSLPVSYTHLRAHETVLDYMLTLSNEEESYTYYITSTTLFIPQVISGVYELAITNGSVSYQGEVEI